MTGHREHRKPGVYRTWGHVAWAALALAGYLILIWCLLYGILTILRSGR